MAQHGECEMQITVIGHLCFDIIHTKDQDGKERIHESLGGIYFTLATLSQLLSDSDRLVPVFGVGRHEYERVLERLSQRRNIATEGIFIFEGPSNQVHLFYGDEGKRVECSRHIADPIHFDRIKPHLAGADGVLINMISGFDLTLGTLDQIRMETRTHSTPTHFDFHSLTLGIDREFTRFRRPIPDWRRWCFMQNSIQMSEEEAAGLTAERYDETAMINQLMPLMVNALIITRGERGATLIRQQHKKLFREEIAGIPAPPPADPTGCGDVFGAAFLYKFILSKEFVQSAFFANSLAAFNATFPGSEGLESLKEHFSLPA